MYHIFKDLLVVFIRFNHVKLCVSVVSKSAHMFRLNKAGFVVGVIASVGVTLVGCFQVLSTNSQHTNSILLIDSIWGNFRLGIKRVRCAFHRSSRRVRWHDNLLDYANYSILQSSQGDALDQASFQFASVPSSLVLYSRHHL